MPTLCILGRQPALGWAELESLFGAEKVVPIGNTAALVDMEPKDINFARLGGTVKFCKVLATLETIDWKEIQKYLENSVAGHAKQLPEGKMRLGFSVYGLNVSVPQINATALALKKVIKKTGRSIRVVPNNERFLNSAQVLHNQLTGPLGWELVFVRSDTKTILAQNIAEQDIEAYSARDQRRPKRDSKVGMLPPKLAQTIINISGANENNVVLDPFCGTGVVLQEALLMGMKVIGTDLEPRMIEYSRVNLEWLSKQNFPICGGDTKDFVYHLEVADAASNVWKEKYDVIAAETYLGRPFSIEPSAQDLDKVIRDVDTIHKKFFANVARQADAGTKMCLAVPAWKTKYGFKHLPVLDQLTDMGYTRVSFKHSRDEDLIYHREGQIVARELVKLIRK